MIITDKHICSNGQDTEPGVGWRNTRTNSKPGYSVVRRIITACKCSYIEASKSVTSRTKNITDNSCQRKSYPVVCRPVYTGLGRGTHTGNHHVAVCGNASHMI